MAARVVDFQELGAADHDDAAIAERQFFQHRRQVQLIHGRNLGFHVPESHGGNMPRQEDIHPENGRHLPRNGRNPFPVRLRFCPADVPA